MLICEIMTRNPITVKASAPIAEAANVMLEHSISGLPVVNDDGVLVGVVSEGDFLRRAELDTERRRSRFLEFLASPGKLANEYVHAHGRQVDQVMTSPVVTISPWSPIAEAVEQMERNDVKRLLVVEDEQLVGVVARSDLLRALVRMLPSVQTQKSDAEIEAQITEELAKRSWSRNGAIRVSVKDGNAELSGTVYDERERLAARVAAENVPGTKSVVDHLSWVDPYYGLVISPP
ncbi:CBS domain-containing protein [Rhizobium sp. RAF56]|uniref:CBS domain-containing protein n=1 Tax=Rhizobium sp. RAF56 TaxID=3233062 RepID=UPI003F94608D